MQIISARTGRVLNPSQSSDTVQPDPRDRRCPIHGIVHALNDTGYGVFVRACHEQWQRMPQPQRRILLSRLHQVTTTPQMRTGVEPGRKKYYDPYGQKNKKHG